MVEHGGITMLRKWHDLKSWEKDICNTSDESLSPANLNTKRNIRTELEENEAKRKLYNKLRKELR